MTAATDVRPSRPRLLWVAVDSLLPADSGGRIRSLSLVAAASREFDVTVASLVSPVDPDAEMPGYADWRGIGHPARREQLGLLPRLIVRGDPPFMRVFATAAQRRFVRKLLDEVRPEVVVADTPYAMGAIPPPTVGVVLNTHNVESEVWHADITSFAEGRVRLAADRLLVRRWERGMLRRAAGIAFTSKRDEAVLVPCVAHAVPTAVVPNAVDVNSLPVLPMPQERSQALFVGRLEYGPNAEAVRFISSELAPLLARHGLTATIVGGGGADRPGLRFAGRMADIRPAYRDSLAAIVPLFSGSGTRLKVLEAMAYGRPVVASAKAVEGLDVVPDVHYLAAESAADFVEQLLRLRDDDLWRRLATAGRRLVESAYSWEAAGEAFLALVARTRAATPTKRTDRP
jgi:polysaccharide biosynthesis protein PslH